LEGIFITLSASEFVAGEQRQTALFLDGLVPILEPPSLVHGPPSNILGYRRRKIEQSPPTTRRKRFDGGGRLISGHHHFNNLILLRTWEQIETKLREVSLQ
jgi:hypothetical protein